MPCCTKRFTLGRRGAALASAALSLLALACEPASEIGLDALTGEPPASATYLELTGSAATVLRKDSVLTANKASALVGELRDGTVGLTQAEAYFQVTPLSANPAAALPADAVADSLVVTCAFGQYYGAADGSQQLELLELDEGFLDDKAYYAESPALATKPGRLAETAFKLRYKLIAPVPPRILTNPWVAGDTATRKADKVRALAPLRFTIKNHPLKESLFRIIGTPGLTTGFKDKLKGLAIRPVGPNQTAIVSLSPAAPDTRMVLYYRLAADTTVRTFTFSIGNTLTERHFTRIKTTYDGDYLKRFAAGTPHDTVNAKRTNGFTAYLQGGLELGTYIQLPGIEEQLRARKGRIAINRAELIIPVKPYAAGVYPVPGTAYLVEVNAANKVLKNAGQLRTVQANSSNPTGTNNPATVVYDAGTRSYRVLLTSYLDARINDKLLDQQAAAFWLLPTLPGVNSLGLNRALIDGSPGQIRLKVYYSELN